MIISEFSGVFNLSLLTEELFEAFPEWRTVNADGFFATQVIIKAKSNGFIIRHPDATTRDAIDAIADAHDPEADSKNQKAKKDKQVTRASATVKLSNLGFTNVEIEEILS